MRQPETTGDARRAIEETRGRISATLDEIEDRIDETRQQIREKVDVARPVRDRLRSRPLAGLGVALGAGLVLGLLTGGKEKPRRRMLDEEEREDLRRWRSERRERLSELRRPAGGAAAPSLIGQLGGVVVSAAMAGLAARARRMITGEPSRARARRREPSRMELGTREAA